MQTYRPILDLLTSAALCIAALATPAHAATAAASPAWAATHTKAHATAIATATDAGTLAAGELVHIAVALQLRDRAALTALTDGLAAGRSTQRLSSRQFLERHAPTPEQATRVAGYLRANGFSNIVTADNRLLVTADGTAAQIKAAFQAELHGFDVRGRHAFANVTDANVPAGLADAVLAVTGLQTVNAVHTLARRAEPQAAATLSVTGISPTLFPSLYGAAGMAAAPGTTIGIITQGSMTQTVADLATFASRAGYPAPNVGVVTVGAASSDTAGIDEWNLDTQTSLAAAGGTLQAMLLYTATTLDDANVTAAYNKAVSDNLARVINVSLGECEVSARDSGTEAANDQIFQVAAAQGQTFSVASGDSGAYECGGSVNQQSYPAVSPYVVAVGGTTLSSSGGDWIGETAWSCSSASACAQSASGGTGGGVSSTEAAPAWQTAAGVLTTAGKRGVPDIAFDASPYSGALILIAGSTVQIGGTSLSAPLFTGFYARVQAAHGNALGFPAPALYAGAASNPGWFHDVSSGSNGGYAAAAGWDCVTGYGSLQVQNFSGTFGTGAAALVANFGCTTSGLTATCTDASTDGAGSIGRYAWTFGDGGTAGSATASHTYAAAGSYTVAETVTENGAGRTATKTAAVTVASDAGPVAIATENQSFSVSGTQFVRYGSGSNWVVLSITGSGTCSIAFFGSDPLVGIVKQCQVLPAAQLTWTTIASENQAFSLSGTRLVRYGSGSTFVSTNVANGGTCSNGFFGTDPLYGVVKQCQVASSGPSAWARIAVENRTFTVDGTQVVRYGSGARWIAMTVTHDGACSNAFFGSDPLVGVVKECQVGS